jgi:CHASE3 domain sensor protein
MTPSEVVTAIGQAARAAARGDGPATDFSRGQLLSAFSASRHLTVELASYPAELRPFAVDVAQGLMRPDALETRAELEALAAELDRAVDAARIGDLVSAALDLVRKDQNPSARAIRAHIHSALRALSDREVELLADAIEGPRRA